MALRAFLIFLLVLLIPSQAKSQMPVACFMGEGIDMFKKQHGEVPIASGNVIDGAVWYLLVNVKTGTWTALIQKTIEEEVKLFCPLASGTEFKFISPIEPKKKGQKA